MKHKIEYRHMHKMPACKDIQLILACHGGEITNLLVR
jgi:hypothetical protein